MRRIATLTMRTSFLAALFAALAACSDPLPPPKPEPDDKPIEPQTGQTGLRDAIQAPIEKAQDVQTQVLDAAGQQRAAIDDEGG